jgi:hypothetical protein
LEEFIGFGLWLDQFGEGPRKQGLALVWLLSGNRTMYDGVS